MLQVPGERHVNRKKNKGGKSSKRGKSLDLDASAIRSTAVFLRAIANENRLTILYLLRDGEKSVFELGRFLALRQPTVSQHLARLREEKIVRTRRDGQVIYYSLASQNARQIIELLEGMSPRPSEH